MPRYTYTVPKSFMLLHHITMDVGAYDYIQITVGGKAKASATNGVVAGVISQTLTACDVLKPVKTFYITKYHADEALNILECTDRVIEFEYKGEDASVLYLKDDSGDRHYLPFTWEPQDKHSFDIDDLFPDPDINEPRPAVRMPLYAMRAVMEILEGMNVQELNFLFCAEGKPALSHYTSYCEQVGELQSSFVTALAS